VTEKHMSSETALATGQRARGLAPFLRSQMRNIAPFLTLICLFTFFAFASPSFATLDNLGNILTQVSITGIIAVGLTFVILCAEIDLSIAAIANVTGIAVAGTPLGFAFYNAVGTIATTTAATNGQILIGSTGVIPVKATITGTASQVVVTNGAGSITLSLPQNIATTSSPTFVSATLSGLTVSSVVFTDAAGLLTSTGTIAVASGGTGLATYAIGDLITASAVTTLARLADVAAGSYLRSGGVGVIPLWSTATLPNTAVQGDLIGASAANVYSNITAVAAGRMLRAAGKPKQPLALRTLGSGGESLGIETYEWGRETLAVEVKASTTVTIVSSLAKSEREVPASSRNENVAAMGRGSEIPVPSISR